MKLSIVRSGLLMLALCSTAQAAKPATTSPVTVITEAVPTAQLLQALAESQRLNVVLAPGVTSQMTMTLAAVSWQQALEAISEGSGMVWRQHRGIIYIRPPDTEKKTRLTQSSAVSGTVRLENKTFRLRHAEAKTVLTLLSESSAQVLSGRGSVVADPRTNRLLARETKDALLRLHDWIAQIDVPLGQVELAAHIVTMNRQSLNALGVQWRRTGRVDPDPVTGIGVDLGVSNATSWLGFNIARIGGRALGIALSAMEQKHQLDIVASPRLLAMHQQPASIKQGSEIPYQVSNGNNRRNSVEFKDAVLGMEVTPEILEGQRIRLKLRITQNMPGQKLKQAEGEVLTIDKQEIETQVIVNNDETPALGGIFQQKHNDGESGVPLLGKMPVVGGVFRSRGRERERRELVVFITPRIVATR